MSACVTAEGRITTAEHERVLAAAIVRAAAEADDIPALPNDCNKRETAGLRVGELQTVVIAKQDGALTRANDRVQRCAAWYNTLKELRE
ncbi:MAG: hypothetical protein AAGG69_00570 [Pseudomonadota bacterium]